MSASPQQPVQLRIGFTHPTRAVTVDLTLSGLLVLADTPDGHYDELWQHLSAAGVTAELHPGGGLTFPVAQLPRLAQNSALLVRTDPVLRPLWVLASNRPADGLPATLERDGAGDLTLSWFDGTVRHRERCDPGLSPALLASDLPFVGTAEAWEVLRERCNLPVLAGRARLNMDGFVEISTTKPQLVEVSPLPGLFRIDDTHFGVALANADAVLDAPGFAWDGRRPQLLSAPAQLPDLPVSLSAHARSDLTDLVAHLAAFQAAALVWDPGLGRRITVLAAVEALDAWPLLIVCPPWSVWLWQRHLDMLGRAGALTHDDADARIVTYLDLARGVPIADPAMIVFDDLASAEAASVEARRACRRLDGVADAYRVAVSDRWPDDPAEEVAVMSVLRPAEFRADMPVEIRYPVHTAERLRTHVDLYLRRRRRDDPTSTPGGFRRSGVEVVEPSEEQLRELTRLAASGPAPEALGAALEVVSVGTEAATSPKLAAAVSAARTAAADGLRVAVLTRHARAGSLLRVLLRPHSVAVVDAAAGQIALDCTSESVVVVCFHDELPDLGAFHTVVVLDYPWSASSLDVALGSQAAEAGPSVVKVLHLAGTVDDRLALRAATLRECGAAPAAPRPEEVPHLLAVRWRR